MTQLYWQVYLNLERDFFYQLRTRYKYKNLIYKYEYNSKG